MARVRNYKPAPWFSIGLLLCWLYIYKGIFVFGMPKRSYSRRRPAMRRRSTGRRVSRRSGQVGRVYSRNRLSRTIPLYGDNEMKYVDRFVDGDSILYNAVGAGYGNGTTVFDAMNAVDQGTAFNQRIGSSILIKRVQISGAIAMSVADFQGLVGDPEVYGQPPDVFMSNGVRLLLVLDRQNNQVGTIPTIGNVLDPTYTAPANPVDLNVNSLYHSFPIPQRRNRYQILYDRKFLFNRQPVNQVAAGGDIPAGGCEWTLPLMQKQFSINVPCNIVANQNGDGDAVSSCIDSCINLYALPMYDYAASANYPIFTIQAFGRVSYLG